MKKKSFNKKLNLKKETVVSLSNSQMNGVNGGNAPVSTDYGYTEYVVNGVCLQPRDCGPSVVCPGFTIDPCLNDTWNQCTTYTGTTC